MLGSLYSGASGVKTHSNAMTVTGSNIANVNTVGYKYNRVNFEDLLSTSLIGNTDTKIGKGVSIGTVQNVQTQGSFEQTELNTDLAIDGDGFFTLRDREGNLFYTRAGQFEYDKEGYLTTRDGKYLQVKDVDPIDKNSFGNLKRINILDQRDPPTPTGAGVLDGTGVEIKANLDANAISPEMDLDLNNVETGMYNFSTSVSVIDQLGNEHTLNIVFGKMEDQPEQIDPATQQPIPGSEIKNTWRWLVLSPGEDIEGGVPGTLKAVGGGFIRQRRAASQRNTRRDTDSASRSYGTAGISPESPRTVSDSKGPESAGHSNRLQFCRDGGPTNDRIQIRKGKQPARSGRSQNRIGRNYAVRFGLCGSQRFCRRDEIRSNREHTDNRIREYRRIVRFREYQDAGPRDPDRLQSGGKTAQKGKQSLPAILRIGSSDRRRSKKERFRRNPFEIVGALECRTFGGVRKDHRGTKSLSGQREDRHDQRRDAGGLDSDETVGARCGRDPPSADRSSKTER